MNGIDGDAPPPSRRRRPSSTAGARRLTTTADDASARDGPMARGAVARDPPWLFVPPRDRGASVGFALYGYVVYDVHSYTYARAMVVRAQQASYGCYKYNKAGHAIGATRDSFCAECPRIVRRMSEKRLASRRSRSMGCRIDRWAAASMGCRIDGRCASMGDAHRCRWAADRPIDRSMARRARRRRRRRPRDDDDGSRAS